MKPGSLSPLTEQGDDAAPLYGRVRRALQKLALERPLDDDRPLPPEPQLAGAFGVSRGTLRKAIEELARSGLLRVKQGRGTFVNHDVRVRRVVWSRLAEVARPDSRFHLDLEQFVPDFMGRERCDEVIVDLPEWAQAGTVFIAPDNSLEGLRLLALGDRKRLLVPTFGLHRGFVLTWRGDIEAGEAALAATLDGLERFGRRLDFADLSAVGKIDLVITGAVAVTTGGEHIGSAHRYLAMEWAVMKQLALVEDATPIIVSVHDCQVVEHPLPEANPDCLASIVVTPIRTIRCRERLSATNVSVIHDRKARE